MKVFVSYSRDDVAAVRSLVDDLERARVQVWLDEELVGGEAWWTVVLEQIRGCEVFLFALSDQSLYSKPCRAELGYAQALGLPILPVQIGDVTSRADPLFTVQFVDYRDPTRNSAFDLISALHERARLRAELPDPLPEPPRIPFEYLQRLGASIHDTTAVLSPPVQAQMLFELRSALSEEDDPTVLDDIRKLLRALRRRSDVTYTIAGEVDALLHSEPTMSGEAPEDESRGGAVPSATGQAHDASPVPDPLRADADPHQPPVPEAPRGGRARRHRRTILFATAVVTIVAIGLIAYLVVTRTSSPHSTVAAAYNCTQVSAPMTSIAPRSDTEPRLRIPQPLGWEQSKMFDDSPVIRIFLLNKSLFANNFTPNALVSLLPMEGGGKVNDLFEQLRSEMASQGATNLSVTDSTVCGRPAQTVSYTQAEIRGLAAAHPAKTLLVADQAADKIYLVSVVVQTTDPANPTYQHDSDMILTGLQVLPPGATG
jgi:hypothetical protein